MEKQQSGDTVDVRPSCGLIPDDPSFCLWLSHQKIHQALTIAGAPCAQGASEQESARLFAEVTWKLACGGISPAVTYRDHVPSYLCEGKWRDHPYVLHKLKMSDCNKIIRELQRMYATWSRPSRPCRPPLTPGLDRRRGGPIIGANWRIAGDSGGGAEFSLVSELARSGVFRME